MRIEKDFIGSVELESNYLFGIHTWRASENFRFNKMKIDKDFFKSVLEIKKATAIANEKAGIMDSKIKEAIVKGLEKAVDKIEDYIPDLNPYQGGAGTSVNMAANELGANLALIELSKKPGNYKIVSPTAHLNLSQSTNDVIPTAVRITLMRKTELLHNAVEKLLSVFQKKEKEFSSILKVGRTQLQDAMPLSLGQEFGAWSDALARFRWRLSKAIDWIREMNLSGTAVGTGINADKSYSYNVIEELRNITRLPIALSRNCIDGTQNADQIVELSGIIKTGAVAIKKICSDLRILSSGPNCGIGEIILPSIQVGSSIMPGKVNPVMLEAGEQIALKVIAGDILVSLAIAESNLELVQFMPLASHTLFENIDLFKSVCEKLTPYISKIKADKNKIKEYLNSSSAVATLLSPAIGYDKASEFVKEAIRLNRPVIELIRESGIIDETALQNLLKPEIMASPGLPVPEVKK